MEDVLRKYLAREWAARRSQPLKRGEALFGKGGAFFIPLLLLSAC